MKVLDASALLALLFREPGWELVGPHLDGGLISTVNLSEVLGRFTRDGIDSAPVLEKILALGLTPVPFSLEESRATSELLLPCNRLGLSFCDRACLALALTCGLPALTADRAWMRLRAGVKIELIR